MLAAALLSFLLLSLPLSVVGGPFKAHRTNVKDNSLIMDPHEQCGYYYNPRAYRGLWNFPPTWKPAMLLANDTAGHAKWDEIKGKVPTNITVKKLVDNSFEQTLANYPADDPDCWWTSHSCIHPKIPGIPDDIATTPPMQAIKHIVGVTPTCWRPPFGDTDDRIRAIAHGLGLRNILWRYDTFDWQFGPTSDTTVADIDANYQAFVDAAKNGTFDREGGIILTHESSNFTMGESMKFYPAMKAAFKHIVPVGVAMNWTHPYVEQDVIQPSFAECSSKSRLFCL
ncbi:hypothetical protein PM082_007705 [Marasmius tenuissimus]|nr:hypothetical protein PM082_007705 [Marasmius tenuissimus]